MFENDRTAPRFNARKFRVNIITHELYEKWKVETGFDVTYEKWLEIWNMIAETIMDEVVNERDGVKLPMGMGEVYLGYVPSLKNRGIDHVTSEKIGKPVYYENWNTSGKTAKIIYSTYGKKYIYRLAGWWSFEPCRIFKHKTIAALHSHPERYKNTLEGRK